MPGGMGGMGRGSDTRIYNPRSESTRLFGTDDEESDIGHAHGYGDTDYGESKDAKRQEKEEKNRKRKEKLKHINIRHKDLHEDDLEDDDQPNKDEEQAELSRLTGPVGNRGQALDIATGARSGTASAMGGTPPLLGPMGVYRSEPMDVAWQLLKREEKDSAEGALAGGEIGSAGTTIERRKQKAKKWSQPQFKLPPGGRRPWTATSRRSKARMRTLAPRHKVSAGKGGLTGAPLAVHMSHLGVKTKQPMRLFPEKYRQYYGQQLRRRLHGNIPQTVSPHPLLSERSFYAGPTGGGRLPGMLPGQGAQMHRPSLRRMRPPQMPKPPQLTPPTPPAPVGVAPPMTGGSTIPSMPAPPSQITMSDQIGVGSEMKKFNLHYAEFAQLRNIIHRLKRKLERAERMNKSVKDTSGAGDDKPKHPANQPKKTTKPEGATENLNDARTWGLEPSQLVGNH